MTEREKLEAALAAQEAMRPTLGDAVVDIAVAALRGKLASLDAPSVAEQRKVVTILFADVSGFTAMSETMDAEEVRDTMNSLWEKLDAAVLKHGGRVDKHIGDALMAIFGVPAAREDDAERAVRAALAMQSELKAFAESAGRGLKMRIGLNTGPVHLGAVGSNSEFTAMGDAVNLASRLEHAAPVGGILVSHDLYLHVRGVFDVAAQEPLSVKGKAEPVKTYVVLAAKPRSFRLGTRGLDIETKMVGRDAELKHLKDDMEATFADRESQMTTVVGDAGVGKSRLLYEFSQWFELHPQRFWYLAGRASPETADAPFGLLKDLFSQRFEIGDGDSVAEVRAKFERGVAGFLKDDPRAIEKSHYIGRLLGFDFSASPHVAALASNPALVRERGVEAVLDTLRAAERENPVLILLEDVHWADDASLDLVSTLLTREKGLRLFVLALARPTLYERRPSWGEGLECHRRIDLGLLSKWDSRKLVEDILSRVEDLPASLRDMVVNGSEGNPFYVEELIRMLIEDGVVDRSGEKWKVNAARLAEAKVPSTLVGVLQARLDSLRPEEKEALQCASVIGRIFWDSGLARMSPASGDALLDKLRGKDMVFRRENSAFTGANEYIFKHALLRDVAYESVLKKRRRDYHLVAAQWLEAQCGERAGEFSTLIARHYEFGGENAKAAEHLRRAAQDAFRRGGVGAAAEIVRRAIALEPAEGTPRRAALLCDAARILHMAGDAAGALRSARESIAICEAAGDGLGVADALQELCVTLRGKGDVPALKEASARLLALAETLKNPRVTGEALAHAGAVAQVERDYARSREMYSRALAVLTELKFDEGMARCHYQLGIIASRLREYPTTKIHHEAAIERYRAIGDRVNETVAMSSLGLCLSRLGDHQGAKDLLRAAAEFQAAHGIKRALASNLDSTAEVMENAGDPASAKKLYLEAASLAIETGNIPSLLTMLAGYARLLSRGGRGEAALPVIACVLAHPSTNGEGHERATGARALVEKALGAKTVEAALAAAPPVELIAYASALIKAS